MQFAIYCWGVLTLPRQRDAAGVPVLASHNEPCSCRRNCHVVDQASAQWSGSAWMLPMPLGARLTLRRHRESWDVRAHDELLSRLPRTLGRGAGLCCAGQGSGRGACRWGSAILTSVVRSAPAALCGALPLPTCPGVSPGLCGVRPGLKRVDTFRRAGHCDLRGTASTTEPQRQLELLCRVAAWLCAC